jgi:hypothetical protein
MRWAGILVSAGVGSGVSEYENILHPHFTEDHPDPEETDPFAE